MLKIPGQASLSGQLLLLLLISDTMPCFPVPENEVKKIFAKANVHDCIC